MLGSIQGILLGLILFMGIEFNEELLICRNLRTKYLIF